jgi:hypothetical protein
MKMSGKHKSSSPSAMQVKNRQKANSTKVKLKVLSQFEKGEQIVDICHNVRFTHSNICTTHDNTDKITEKPMSGTNVFT